MEIYRPDFKKAYIAAHEKLLALSAGTFFPLCAGEIIKKFTDFHLLSYQWAEEQGFPSIYFQSESSELKEMNGVNILFYNKRKPIEHSRFSILHELGHIVLLHDMNAGKSNPELYKAQEAEANLFAAEMQMPEPVINEFKKRGLKMNAMNIQKLFGTSRQASEIRFRSLSSAPMFIRSKKIKEIDDFLVNHTFKKFIDFHSA